MTATFQATRSAQGQERDERVKPNDTKGREGGGIKMTKVSLDSMLNQLVFQRQEARDGVFR